jgi:hypothetical protein
MVLQGEELKQFGGGDADATAEPQCRDLAAFDGFIDARAALAEDLGDPSTDTVEVRVVAHGAFGVLSGSDKADAGRARGRLRSDRLVEELRMQGTIRALAPSVRPSGNVCWK